MFFTVLIFVCFMAVTIAFFILPGESTLAQRKPFWGRYFAHRGLHNKKGTIPENSLPAFTAAVEANLGIELDLRMTLDGEIVAFHDENLHRMCKMQRLLEECSLAELSHCTLQNTEYKIPTLKEILIVVDEKVPLIIELKTCKDYKKLCRKTWDILKTYDGDFCIQSFDPRILYWFRKHVPGILRGQLAAKPAVLNAGLGGFIVGVGLSCFIGRPQFISYQVGNIPPLVYLSELFCMRIRWTVQDSTTCAITEQKADAVIFEFFTPVPTYKEI